MSFRCRQKLTVAFPADVFQDETQVNNDGNYVFTQTNLSKAKLPDSEMFALGKLLDAGVNLEEVNSKVLSQKTINAKNVIDKYSNEKEVENENEQTK